MRGSTVLPVDKNGNAVPVFIPDTGKTQTIAIANDSTVAAATAFSNVTKTMAYYTTDDIFAGENYMTFTSKIEGYPSENISIEIVNAGDALAVSISGYAITIAGAGKEPKCSEIKAAFEANEAINKLVSVSYTTAGEDDPTINSDAEVARTFLSGWDDGKTPMIVELTATKACKYHVGPITLAGGLATTCKGYIGEGQTKHIGIMPGEIISAVGLASSPGALLYITPGREF